jgi:hypothetical protein
MLLLLALANPAIAGDYMDIWVTSAFEDSNLLAGPDAYSPALNFVERGNRTFFENYESRSTDDISRSTLVLYRADEGYRDGWSTEAAFVLRYTPYLNPDATDPGTSLEDDGSYVRIIRSLAGNQEVSLTGYAVDAGRFRLGYSYDLTWGGREIHSFEAGAAPGVRLQWQDGTSYAFAGVKTAVGDYVDPISRRKNNQAYYGNLFGAGTMLGDSIKIEGGAGLFQQGQILNVDETTSPLYGELIEAVGVAGQVAWKSREDMDFFQSADLRLVRNQPDFVRETYISHDQIEGTGIIVQAEVNHLSHNLLSPTASDQTVVESGIAADLQTLVVSGSSSIAVDLVYKDLAYILFNVPGLTSGVGMNPDMESTPQLYGRVKASHYFEGARVAPSLGIGLMQPATYSTTDGVFVQYTERDKEQVPEGQAAAPILSAVAGVQVDMSPSVVLVGELLYTQDENQSQFVQTSDNPEGTRLPAPDNERQVIGANLMMRARF